MTFIMFLLTVTGIFVASNIYTTIPLAINFINNFQITVQQSSLSSSLFTVSYAVGLLCFGPLSDQFGRKKVLVYGLLFSVFFTFSIGLATSFFLLCVFRILQGFTLASFAPVAFALAFDLYPNKQRTLLLAYINTGFLAAGIIGQMISSIISYRFPWSYVFFFFAFCYLVLYILLSLSLPKTQKPKGSNFPLLHTFQELLKDRNLQKCYLITATIMFSFISFYTGLENFYTGPFQELTFIRSVGLAGAVLSLFSGKILVQIGLHKMLRGSLILGIISLTFMAIFPDLITLLFFSVLFVSSISILIPVVISLVGTIAGMERGKALSLYSFILLSCASLAAPVSLLIPFQLLLTALGFIFLINFCISFFIET
jgi:MFS family permease